MRDVCRLWVRKMAGQKIIASEIEPCDPAEYIAALAEICRRMDVPRPMWLSKHEKAFASFRRTAFTQDDFIERISFTRLEIEMLLPESERVRAPRHPISDA